MLDLKLVRFLVVGLGNTLLGLLAIYAFKWADIGDVISNALGYGVGIIFSFCLNRQWTFRHKASPWAPFMRFIVVIGVAYALNLLVVMSCINALHINAFIAQALGIPAYTIVSYLGSRYYVFSESDRRKIVRPITGRRG
jgi:putative flippase GtrA